MAQGQEFLTSNRYIAYPFAEDALGIQHGEIPRSLFVDMALICDSEIPKLYLDEILYIGGEIYLVFVDGSGTTIYTCQGAWVPDGIYTSPHFAVNYPSGVAIYPTIRVVFHTETMNEWLAANPDGKLFGTGILPLETSVQAPRPKKVLTFDLYTTPDGMPAIPEPDVEGPIRGDVKFMSGYNIDQFIESPVIPAQANEPVLDTVAVQIAVVPGAGEGPYPCDDPEEPELEDDRRRMPIVPDEHGNINIEAGEEKCYAIVPLLDTDQLQIQGTCQACCQCEDFDNVAKKLQDLLERSKDILNDNLIPGRERYEEGVTHFNSTISPLYHTPYLKLNGAAGAMFKRGDDATNDSHSCNKATVVGALKNNFQHAIVPVQYELAVSAPSPVKLTMTAWEYDGEGNKMELLFKDNLQRWKVPPVETGKSIYFEFRLLADFLDMLEKRTTCINAKDNWHVSLTIKCYNLGEGKASGPNRTFQVYDEVKFG